MFPSRRIATSGGDAFRNEHSLVFDGSNDYINCGNDSSLQISGNMTYSCWFKTSSAAGLLALIDKLGSNTGMFIFLSSGMPRIWIGNGSSNINYESIGSDLRDGRWHHLVVVNDEAVATYVYVDGTAYNNGTATDMAANTTDNFNIGSYSTTAWDWEGHIGEVAVWAATLTSNEIKTLYNNREPFNAKSIAPSRIKGYWRMGDGVLDDFNANTAYHLVTDEVTPRLGSELHDATWNNKDLTSFDLASATGFTSRNTNPSEGGNDNAYGKKITTVAGGVYRYSFTIDITAVTTGVRFSFNAADTGEGTEAFISNIASNTIGATGITDVTVYFTTASSVKYYPTMRVRANGVYEFTVSNFSFKQVSENAGLTINMDAEDLVGDTH